MTTIPSSGLISFSTIRDALGITGKFKLSDAYGTGTGVPTSGRMDLSVFYGKNVSISIPATLPPSPMTNNSTDIPPYGTFSASVTSALAGVPFNIFDGTVNTSWSSANGTYAGAYIGTNYTPITLDTGTSNYGGEYVQLTCPRSYTIKSYSVAINPLNNTNNYLRSPGSFSLVGSVDGTTWKLLHSASNVTYPNGQASSSLNTYNVTNQIPSRYYRFIIHKVVGSANAYTNFADMILYT